MAEGWIKIHRKLLSCDIWENDQPFDMRSAWVDLILLANHRDIEMLFDYEPLTIKRGQYLTSVRKLGARWSWSKNRTLKYLRLLENLKMIERESSSKRTLITIVNYGVYQDVRDTDMDTGVDTGMDTGMPQTRMIKNDKEINNNRTFVKPTIDEVKEYCLERNNEVDPEAFVSFYESKAWMIGKNKMKDWKAAVRTWERSRKGKAAESSKSDKPKFGDFNQRSYDYGELMKSITN